MQKILTESRWVGYLELSAMQNLVLLRVSCFSLVEVHVPGLVLNPNPSAACSVWQGASAPSIECWMRWPTSVCPAQNAVSSFERLYIMLQVCWSINGRTTCQGNRQYKTMPGRGCEGAFHLHTSYR